MSASPVFYQNPVYNRSFPDPFVLKFAGSYYAFSTGRGSDGGVFAMLRSTDLIAWDELPGAMAPLEPDHPYYWAPEATYEDGRFYLYYSVGNETLMEIRVAVSDRPDGGYVDAGLALTSQDFAIDPHVVRDDDGRSYMFYATDFLEHTHIGTGVVVDRMLDPYTLEGKPRPVTRAKFDWQVYDPARKEKGGVRWHTVEGPFVIKRKGIYYEMFSGGNWQNISYGVSYAVSDKILADEEWEQFSDGIRTLPILRTIPGKVVGPGHNSVVRGPNGRDLYCVYHYWSDGARVLAIDRMDLPGGGRLFVVGPTTTVQPAPSLPQTTVARPGRVHTGESFLCEVTLCNNGRIHLVDDDDRIMLGLDVRSGGLAILRPDAHPETVPVVPTKEFKPGVPHTITLEVDGRQALLNFDGRNIDLPVTLEHPPTSLDIDRQIEILDLTLTHGFEDRFEDSVDEQSALARGWTWTSGDKTPIFIEDGILTLTSGRISRKAVAAKFEFAVNFRLAVALGDDPVLGVECGVEFLIHFSSARIASAERVLDLPTGFEPSSFNQVRSVSDGRNTTIWLNETLLGTVGGCTCSEIEIFARDASVDLDMVRFTVH